MCASANSTCIENRGFEETHKHFLPAVQLLINLAERAKLKKKINAMFNGERINLTEDRAVLHVALRAPRDKVP